MKLRLPALMTVIVLSLTACGRAASQPSEAPVTVTSNCLAEAPTPAPEATPTSLEEPPLQDWMKEQPVPEFLDEEQQELFLHAYSAANFLMGCSTSYVDEYPTKDGTVPDADLLNSAEYVALPNGPEDLKYRAAVGRYARWDDFKAMMDSLFTAEYQEKELLNYASLEEGVTVYHPIFASTGDGGLCYLELDRGSYLEYDWCDTPDSYELVSQSEDEIVFDLVGHYGNLETVEFDENGISHPTEEYTETYPIRMELTDAGWRFSEFHLPY